LRCDRDLTEALSIWAANLSIRTEDP